MKLQGRNLSLQSQGEDVKLLHSELRQLGYTIAPSELDSNTFLQTTRDAVIAFQRDRGISPTGIVDSHTAREINFAVDAQQERLVRGKILLSPDNCPLPGVAVEAIDKDFRAEERLGVDITHSDGAYKIFYTAEQFARAEKHSADLMIRVTDPKTSLLLGTSDIVFNASNEEIINLTVTLPQEPELSEYEKLVAALSPIVGDVSFANLTDEDTAFLAGETGEDRQRIEFLRQSALLANETNLPTYVFYGFARRGLSLELETLLNQDSQTLREALIDTIEEQIIPNISDDLDDILSAIAQLKLDRGTLVNYSLFGQLLNQNTEAPLSGFTVRGFMFNSDGTLVDLGQDITQINGLFTVTYTAPRLTEGDEDPPQQQFRLEIATPAGEIISTTDITVSVGQTDPVEVPVSVPEAPDPSPPLTEVSETLNLEISPALQDFLAQRNIQSLSDIRTVGGLRNLEGTPDAPAVATLDAHANLNLLSNNIGQNQVLIDRRYTSIGDIANATRSDFVSVVGEQLGDFQAAQTQVKARAQKDFLNNFTASIRADLANGFPNSLFSDSDPDNGDVPNNFEEIFNPTCSCRDCEAATSPVAYLADLLDYTTNKVKKDDTAITLTELTALFHQPFGDLSTSCEIQQQQVRQVRLCIEVLRSYLKEHPPTAAAEAILERAEKEYRLNAYQILLNQIGTSYDELRQTRGNSEEQEALAKRLGIAPDKLDLLFLDPDAEETEPKAITEETLEIIFGLKVTNHFGNKQDDPLNQVVNWEFQGVELGKNTDSSGYVYLNLELIRGIAEYVWTVEVFSDRDRTQLVAKGSSASPASSLRPGDPADSYQGTIELNAIGNSGLTGTVTLDYQIGSNEIVLFLGDEVQGLLSWRLEYLRTLWQEEDWPQEPDNENPPEEIPDVTPPIIDPDLIGLAYLTNWSDPDDPAYQIWQARQEWIEGQLEEIRTYTQDLAGFEQVIADKLLLPDVLPADESSTLLEYLYNQREEGHDITLELNKLSLTNGAFLYLWRLQNLLVKDEPVLDTEWAEVYNILVQVQKLRQYETWRAEEKESKVILSPDSFQIPEPPPLEFPPPEPQPLPNWRATQQALRNWEDKLQSRVEQQQTIKEALQAAISATEEATLPMLRDALIMATDVEGDDLDTKADWITKNLLIDAQAGSCQETTRIAQAIETIQSLLWGLKINQFWETYPDLELGDREIFDEIWKWLGSYANWRAAMMVFLYPENILRPELRKWQTPAFRQLVDNVRNNRRLTPERACQEAKAYSDYFADIATLEVEATCQTRTRIHSGDCRNRMAKDSRSLFYMFARGGRTNTVYWSAYDSQDESGYAQTFWEALPGVETEKVINIIGAVPYQISIDERFIYLFVLAQGDSEQKLGFTTYNLQTQQWTGQLTELEVPEDATIFSAVVEQRDDETQPPHLAICIPRQTVYSLKFNSEGTGWQNFEEPHLLRSNFNVKSVLSLIGFDSIIFGKFNFIFIETSRNEIQVGLFSQIRTDLPISLWGSLGQGSWIGAFLYPGTADKVYFYLRNVSEVRYGIIDSNNLDNPARFWGPVGLKRIAVHSGQEPELKGRRLAYQNDSGQVGVYQVVFRQAAGDRLNLLSPTRITPRIPIASSIPEQASEDKLHFRRCEIKNTFQQNEAGLQSNLTYIKEAYYFVPIYLALQLQQQRYFPAALNWYRTVYAYNLTIVAPNESTDPSQPNFCETPSEDQPKIYYGLKLEESLPRDYQRAEDWLLDPLNPHLIASTRRNTYTRFTLLSIVRCFLEYADDEFTRDTAESVPRARTLYLIALELLDRLEQQEISCQRFINALDTEVSDQLEINAPELLSVWHQIKRNLLQIKDEKLFKNAVRQATTIFIFAGEEPWIDKLRGIQAIVDRTLISLSEPPNFTKLLQQKAHKSRQIYAAMLAQPEVSQALENVADLASKDYLNAVSVVSGITTQALKTEKISFPWLRQKAISTRSENASLASAISATQPIIREDYRRLAHYNPVAPTHLATLAQIAKTYPLQAVQIVQKQPSTFVPSLVYGFCIPLNPVLDALRLWAELNLYKLRTCRNIAGIERELEPYAAPTDTLSSLPQIGAGGQLILPGSISFPATPYRYAVLIDRAKQLVTIAQQIEASFLSALEKLDAELYNLLKARQDIQLTRAGVRLQDWRVREAESGVDLAELQRERSQIQVDHYSDLIKEGKSGWEIATLSALGTAAGLLTVKAGFSIYKAIATSGLSELIGSIFGSDTPSQLAAAASASAELFSTFASYERREQEWRFQEKLSQQDVRIGDQQIEIAQDRVRIVGQERVISQMQADFAKETLDFLTTKFTNVELYDWMVGILEQVYSFFLQQATATAKLAENQLAFERQEIPPAYIQADYWEVPNDNISSSSQNGNPPDRRGLTGSARLLQDIYQLDQYAFETDRRKLQLTKTISLARLAPAEFQSFRETGVILFSTAMELFDRDFPGHYLRLIKRVRTSIIALIPPNDGIKATLSTTGFSRVVIGQNNVFQSVEINRPPESIALTSPQNATGLFELTPQSPEMLLPFESTGVATSWELCLPKASNFFDYSTIADVLITIEYTALNNFTYRQQVIQELGNDFSGDRPFSFRNEFSDQWFDLHNPDQTETPMVVRFETRREDFPPNLTDLSIQQVVLYFARAEGASFEIPVTLNFTEQSSTDSVGGEQRTIDGIISTRRGNGTSWLPMIGKSPVGEWELSLPNTEEVKKHFQDEEVDDILFVITYQGQIPPWSD